jgi:glycosyltransferase involved in cell wall biosynthesis
MDIKEKFDQRMTPPLVANVSLVGPYPLPYGGVSVHVQRLRARLEEKKISCVNYVLNESNPINKNVITIKYPLIWAIKYSIFSRERIIHFHYSDWKARTLFGLMTLVGKTVIISVHSERLIRELTESWWLKRGIIQFALKKSSFIIAVNPRIKTCIQSVGISPEKIRVIPAFIPPNVKNDDIVGISKKIMDFIDQHRPIVSANAFKIVFFKGEDLYGIDLCIDLCYRLKENWKNVGFIFFLPEIGEKEYFQSLEQKIIQLNLQNNFLFITEPCPFYPALMKSDVFIRPTNTDGDAVSIREALFFKIPTIASDCIERPEGTIIFANRNIDDLTIKTEDLLNNYHRHKEKIENLSVPDCASEVIQIYKELLSSEE